MRTMIDRRPMTASGLREELEGKGVTGPAQDAIIRETARQRHLGRVQTVCDTAVAWAMDHEEPCVGEGVAALLCLLDVVGIGGLDRCGGDGTSRIPPFTGLGKGRKQASDGPAWSSAVSGALDLLVRSVTERENLGCQRLVLSCSVEEIEGEDAAVSIDLRSPDEESVLGMILPQSAAGEFEALLPWIRTLAREGLRRSLGMEPWFDLSAFSWQGDPGTWAKVVNTLESLTAAKQIREAARVALGWPLPGQSDYRPSEHQHELFPRPGETEGEWQQRTKAAQWNDPGDTGKRLAEQVRESRRAA